MLIRLFCFCFGLLAVSSLYAQTESDYIRMLGEYMGGELEESIPNGRIDILTDQYAIEVEFAAKWKNSIGQALWYALNTQHQPAIILILESQEDNRLAIMLESTLDYAGLEHVQVWKYPADFPGLNIERTMEIIRQERLQDAGFKTPFWLTINSNKRHREGCSNYEHSNGRYCREDEGIPAGCCH